MTDRKHDDGQGRGTDPSGSADVSDPQKLRQSLLTALIELDFAYERERIALDQSSADAIVKARLMRKLKEQRRQKRQPYLQKLIVPQPHVPPELKREATASDIPALTHLEADLMRSVMAGASNAVIAAERGLDEMAVKDHIKSVLRKVRSKTPH
jgi:DNA-binding CsgD family transcriptional regulator